VFLGNALLPTCRSHRRTPSPSRPAGARLTGVGSHRRHNVPPPCGVRLGDVRVHLPLDSNSPFLRDLPPAASAEVLRHPLAPCGMYLRERGGSQVGNVLGRCSERTRAPGFAGLVERSPLRFAQRHCFIPPLNCFENCRNREPCNDPESHSRGHCCGRGVNQKPLSATWGAFNEL